MFCLQAFCGTGYLLPLLDDDDPSREKDAYGEVMMIDCSTASLTSFRAWLAADLAWDASTPFLVVRALTITLNMVELVPNWINTDSKATLPSP